jgi:hypothetical protein
MTSEIALMNRQAIALAADSAITVTYWRDGERKERYFKGANKIFNLSAVEPVALMINDTADLQGVPWEIIAKAFRESIGSVRLDKLADYSKAFFKFLEESLEIYPIEHRAEQFLSDAQISASFLFYLVDREEKIKKEDDAVQRKSMADAKWAAVKGRVERAAFIDGASQADIEAALLGHRAAVEELLKQDGTIAQYFDVIPVAEVATLAVTALYKKGLSILATSGIVIAGFGAKEFFPKIESHKHHGMILGRTLCECEQTKEISQKNASEVLPFAQSDMARTFLNGISNSVLREIETSAENALRKFEKDLKDANLVSQEVDLSVQQQAAKDSLGDEIIDNLISSHTSPMKRVVGLLPIDELAELAEILIRIESLKERVTRESEQVGGPIDVAVLSKGDGFIWIKRKHYFDPDLNPRYFSRRGVQHGQQTENPGGKVRSRKSKAGAD